MWVEIPLQHVHFAPAEERADEAKPKAHKLIGYVSALFAYVLIIDGFQLVCRASGRYSILFPTCRTPGGKIHRTVIPQSRRERREIERRLLDVLRAQRVIP
jgi:hypothetical protein